MYQTAPLPFYRTTVVVFAAFLYASMVGCASRNSPAAPSEPPIPVTTGADSGYRLSGGLRNPGIRPLHGGETVASVVHENLAASLTPPPLTIIYVRRGPEGKTRQVIDITATGHLAEPGQDQLLRDGDELIFPMTSTRPVTSPAGASLSH